MAVKITIPRTPPNLDSSEVNVKNMLLVSENEKITIQVIIKIVMINFTPLFYSCQLH